MAGIFDQFGKNFRRFPQDLSIYDDEYLRYCVEREQVESELESTLHETDDPNEIISTTLKTVCAFYGGNWTGVMDIDTDTRIWRPLFWSYADGVEDKMIERLSGLEDAEPIPRWIDSVHSATPIVLTDISILKGTNPAEYELYRRLDVDALMFYGTSIATCVMVLKKSKGKRSTLFIDASNEFVKVTKNNKLTNANIDAIIDAYAKRENREYFSRLVPNEEVAKQDYNLSVSTHVEQRDDREKIDIQELNAQIEQIVAKEQSLREQIEKIIADIEDGGK